MFRLPRHVSSAGNGPQSITILQGSQRNSWLCLEMLTPNPARPPGTTLEMHQNLRANLDRLYFAGEATSSQYFGFLHGAWSEGQAVGEAIAGLIKGVNHTGEVHYETLRGTTDEEEYNAQNGWQASTFLTYGFE